MSDTNYKDSYYDGEWQFKLCTATIANPAIFLRKQHGLNVNDRVQFRTDDTLPTGISKDTWYFVVSGGMTSDTFEVSTSKGGTALQLTVAGSGNLFFASDRPRRLSVNLSDSTR